MAVRAALRSWPTSALSSFGTSFMPAAARVRRAFFAEHGDADVFERALVGGVGDLCKCFGLNGGDLLLHGKAVGHSPKPAAGQSLGAGIRRARVADDGNSG